MGRAALQRQRTFDVGYNPASVTTGDFNGDGNLDLATTNSTSSNVSILLGNGTGEFSGLRYFDTGDNPSSITTGDFNSDGKLDLATANPDQTTSLFYSATVRAASLRHGIPKRAITLTRYNGGRLQFGR
jgi:hypothetical protein